MSESDRKITPSKQCENQIQFEIYKTNQRKNFYLDKASDEEEKTITLAKQFHECSRPPPPTPIKRRFGQ